MKKSKKGQVNRLKAYSKHINKSVLKVYSMLIKLPLKIKILGGIFVALLAIFLAITIFPQTVKVTNHTLKESEINQYLSDDMKLEKGDKVTNEVFDAFISGLNQERISNTDIKQEVIFAKEQIGSTKYPAYFAQAVITPEDGGTLENKFVKVEFEPGSVNEPIVASVRTPVVGVIEVEGYTIGDRITLTASNFAGTEIHGFNKNYKLTTKDIAGGVTSETSTYYLNKTKAIAERLDSEIFENDIVAYTDHFSDFVTLAQAPAGDVAGDLLEEYPYEDCGTLIDDSFEVDEDPEDEIDRSACFTKSNIWIPQQAGVYRTSFYSNEYFSTARWYGDYKSINGNVEVFATLPDVADLRGATLEDPGTGEEVVVPAGEYAIQAVYYIFHADGIEEVKVEIDMSEELPGKVSLNSYEFDGTAAQVFLWGLTIDEANAGKYIVADAVCFGDCPAGVSDITPPTIENAKVSSYGNGVLVQADVTDSGSGVKSVYISINGKIWKMNGNGDKTYSVYVPGFSGTNLDYYIIAYDKAGNEAIWNPTRGYVNRGMGLGIGKPPESQRFVNFKYEQYNRIMPAQGGLDPCNACTGDPVNTMNGNLLEQVELAKIEGRAPIDFAIQYNSLGGQLGIFGENWTHSYNYKLVEFNGVDFTGVIITYPGGNVQEFALNGTEYKAVNPFLTDKVTKVGDNFVLMRHDQTKVIFDSFGDAERIEDMGGNGVGFEYDFQETNINFSKLTKIKSDSGREIKFLYNGAGLVLELESSDGTKVKFDYNDSDDLVSVLNEKSDEIRFDVEDHKIIKKYSPEGHTYYINTYDSERRVNKQISGDEFAQNFTYLPGETHVVDANGTTAKYFHEGTLMKGNKDELGTSTVFEYDENDRIMAEINGAGERYEYAYDDHGNQIYTKYPDGTETHRTFNDKNQLTFEKDKREDNVRTWEYDAKGNLTKETDPLGGVVKYEYNSKNELTKVIDAMDYIARLEYSVEGDITKIIDAEGGVTSFDYDDLGRLTGLTNAEGNKTKYKYDTDGNLVEVAKPLGVTERYEYDRNNRLIKTVDANGNETVFAYDTDENLVKSINAHGDIKEFSYGQMNELLSQKDEEAAVTAYSYTPDYQLKKITKAAGSGAETSAQYSYDGVDAPTGIVDGLGRVTSFKYDKIHQLVSKTEDDGGLSAVTSYTYNSTGAVIERKDAEGRVTKYTLDAKDRVITVTDAEGGLTKLIYDANDNITSSVDPNGNTTAYEYDHLNRQTKVTNPSGVTTSTSYNKTGNVTEIVNENGIKTRYEYDELGRPVKKVENWIGVLAGVVTDVFGGAADSNVTTEYGYDANGNVVKVKNPRGYESTFVYDKLNRLISATDALGKTTQLNYDKVGNLVSTTDRNGNSTTTEYDELYRVVKTVNARGNVESRQYDKTGNLTQHIDARGNSTKYSYSGLNQQTEMIDALGGRSFYSYDKVNNVLKAVDQNGHAYTYLYDGLSRVTTLTNPEGHSERKMYDPNGNLTAYRNRNGNSTLYTYDELDRLVSKFDELGGSTSYTYDEVGNVIALTDENGHTDKFEYDDLDRKTEETDAEGNDKKTEYDANGNNIKTTDGNGHSTTFEFDPLDRMVQSTNAESEATSYEFDSENNVIAMIEPDGVRTGYIYDPVYTLIEVILDQSGLNINTKYSYDENSNLTAMTDPKGGSVSYAYDSLNRQVKEINQIGSTWTYGYDPAGNRTSRADANGNRTTYSYYPDNELKSIGYGSYSVNYGYDPNNNETFTSDNLGTTESGYDALDRLRSVDDALGRKLGYGYDKVGNRAAVYYPDGRTVYYDYYKNDWMKSMKDPDGRVSAYEYDGAGNNTKISSPNGTVGLNKFDKVNRMTSIFNGVSGGGVNSQFSYTYDNVGQRTSVSKIYGWEQPLNVSEVYSYDNIRRLVHSNQNSSKGNIWNNYNYDRNSNRVAWKSNDNSRTPRPFDKADLLYKYDAANELLLVHERGYTADPQSGKQDVAGISTTGGSITTSSPTQGNGTTVTKYKKVTKTLPMVVAGFTNALNNFQKELEAQEGKQISQSAYDDLFTQTEELIKQAEAGMLTRAKGEELLAELRKSIEDYDASGAIKAPGITNSLLVKLTEADDVVANLPVKLPTETVEVPYQEQVPGTPPATLPGGQNTPGKPGEVKGEEAKIVKEIRFSYDANGNRISMLIDGPTGPEDQLTLYSYDPENRLGKVVNHQRGNTENDWVVRDITSMNYDAWGRRLVKTYDPKINTPETDTENVKGARRVEYVYNGRDPVVEYDMTNSHQLNLYRGIGDRIGSYINYTPDGDQGKHYMHYDALNSVVGITKDSGGNDKNYRYDDYGLIAGQTGQTSGQSSKDYTDPHNHYTYTGQEWDENMEVYEFYSRAYDPVHGVWLRQDDYRGTLTSPQSLHRYMYVNQGPTNWWDEDGYVAALLIASIAVDWGLDIWDWVNTTSVINNPNSTLEEISEAEDTQVFMVGWYIADFGVPIEAVLPIDDICRVGYRLIKFFDGKAVRGPVFDLLRSVLSKSARETIEVAEEKVVKEGADDIINQGSKGIDDFLDDGIKGGSKIDDLVKKIDADNLKFSDTVTSHTDRPYRNSSLTVKEIMSGGAPVLDPQGISGVVRWDVPGNWNSSVGIWELVINTETNTVIHLLFKTK